MTQDIKTLKDAVARNWNRNADQWAMDVSGGLDLYRDLFTWPEFESFLGDVRDLDVIDFGCGEGTNTRRLARSGAHMTGIDLASGMVAKAQAAEKADPLGITYHVGSFSDPTSFDDGSFDRVVSTLALMDGPDLPGAMREAYRLLRPGGEIVFSVLHPCHFSPGGLRWAWTKDRTVAGLIIGKYHDRQPRTEQWQFERQKDAPTPSRPFEIMRFPRTLADWINAVTDAGLVLTRLEEPVPSEAAIARYPILERWRDHAAFLLLLRARRPH